MTGSTELVEVSQEIHAVVGEKRRIGRIAAFVTPDKDGDEREIYCISAAHVFGFRSGAKILNREGRKIGKADWSRFNSVMDLWRVDPNYSCLKEVGVIRIDPDVAVRNSSGHDPVRSVMSPIDHFLQGNGEVFVKGDRFGVITRVRANPEIMYADGLTVRTRGFFVNRENSSVEVHAGSSGRPVFTAHGELLGMIIASMENELFCLDFHEILQLLGCRLLDYSAKGYVERTFA
ncbi:hypothetical protein [Sphingomonas sp. 28-62-11]|uniref:hypothetical protein n=1 Tax=Sphingomonas sp. 28-62-11 TaxID=1970432 RepID=UPI000BCAC582|nr:MAG: hypothetical protein B7Y49_08070 [Sphingomonas sp. 28-62-11]